MNLYNLFLNKTFFTALSFTLLFSIACSDVNLVSPVQPPVNAKSEGTFCTFDPIDIDFQTNILVILDYSGSNRTYDPQRVRVRKTKEFYESKKGEGINWSFATFDTNSRPITKDGDQGIFTNDETILEDNIRTLERVSQNGSKTNYEKAMDLADDIIQHNESLYPDRRDYYYIYFLSDGRPNDGRRNESQLRQMVRDIRGNDRDRIYLATAFYGNPRSNTAKRLMAAMADEGGGEFIDFNNLEDLDFEDFFDGIERNSWVMKQDSFVVFNLNSTVCLDGSIGLDSDADGLCDKDEIKYGFDPTKRSTPMWDEELQEYVDRGYSDYFQLLEMKGYIILPHCPEEDRVDWDHDLLNNCEERLVRNMNPSGTEWPRGNIRFEADPRDPDTDNDGIIDGIEVLMFKNHLGWALDDRINKDYDGEGVSAFQQIQEHRNPLMYDKHQPAYDVQIEQLPPDGSGRFCYSYSQSVLPLYPTLGKQEDEVLPATNPGENLVLVYFIQNKFNDPNGKGIYMFSLQKLVHDSRIHDSNGSSAGLKVRSDLFTPYETYRYLGNFQE